MTTATTIITVMHCGCTESVDEAGSTVPVPAPSVPMTTTVKTCNCGEANAPSTTEVTIPCTSQIEEMSSSMASPLASAAPGVAAPTIAPAAEATGHGSGGESVPEVDTAGGEQSGTGAGESESTATENTNDVAGAPSEARSGDVPEITNSLAEVGAPTGNNGTYYATTKTINLEPAVTETSSYHNGTVSAPRLEPSPTKKSEGSIAVERLVGYAVMALFCTSLVMSLL